MSTIETEELSPHEVFGIALRIAVRHHLRRPNYSAMIREARGKFPQPLVLKNENGTLWLDLHYVAYQLSGHADVKYVYITYHHITEECLSYTAATKARGKKIRLPSDIARQFQSAKKQMRDSGTGFWIDSE